MRLWEEIHLDITVSEDLSEDRELYRKPEYLQT